MTFNPSYGPQASRPQARRMQLAHRSGNRTRRLGHGLAPQHELRRSGRPVEGMQSRCEPLRLQRHLCRWQVAAEEGRAKSVAGVRFRLEAVGAVVAVGGVWGAVYMGAFNPTHERFVVDHIVR